MLAKGPKLQNTNKNIYFLPFYATVDDSDPKGTGGQYVWGENTVGCQAKSNDLTRVIGLPVPVSTLKPSRNACTKMFNDVLLLADGALFL